MAWTRRTVTFGALASTTTRTVTKPTGTVDGDLILIGVYREDNTSNIDTIPSGFTEIATEVVNTGSTPDIRLRVYWKIASGEGANYTFTWTTTAFSELIAIAYTEDTGAFPANPIDQTNTGTGNSGTPGTTGVTTTAANTMKVLFSVNFDGDAYTNGATGMTERGDGSAHGLHDELQAAAGASGAEACAIGGAQWASRLIAIFPGSAGATYTATATPSLPALTASGTGTFTAPTYTGTAAVNLPALTAAGTGTHPFIGTATPSLPAITASGDGTHTAPTYTATATPSLPALTASGTGTFSSEYLGAAAVSLPAITASGAGTFASPDYTATATVNLPAVTAAGTGTFTAPTYTGSAAITLPPLTASGTGTHPFIGTAAISLPALTASGTGTHTAPTYTGTAAIILPVMTADGTGTFASALYTATAALTLPVATASGAGTFTAPAALPEVSGLLASPAHLALGGQATAMSLGSRPAIMSNGGASAIVMSTGGATPVSRKVG